MAHRVLARGALALLSALAAALPLEGRAELPPDRRIVSVEGPDLPGFDVALESGLAAGDELTEARARDAIWTLWATGRLRDVRLFASPAPGGGLRVRIAVELRQTVRRLEVSGNRALERREVVRAAGYMAGEPYGPEDRERIVEALREAYRHRGYPEAEVALEVLPVEGDPGGVGLRLVIEEGEPLRIAEVRFDGRAGLDPDRLAGAFGLGPGDVLDGEALREGVERLVRLYREEGYYQARVEAERIETETSEAGEARLVVPVDSGDHYEVTFAGNRSLSDADLMEVLDLDEERRLTRAVLEGLAGRLRDRYRGLGFHHARVDCRVVQLRPGERRLAFRIRRGPRTEVREIRFEGNRHFEDRYLRRQVVAFLEEQLSEEGVFGRPSDDELSALGLTGETREAWREGFEPVPALRVRPSRTYVEETYLEAIEHIRRLYEADGFLQARFEGPELALSDRGRLIAVTIRIDEGPQTRVGSITFGGNRALDDETLGEALGLELEEPFDRYQVEQARRRLVDAYRGRGFVYAAVEVEQYLSEDGEWADLSFFPDEGDQVLVGDVLIRGNELTRDGLIRERLSLRPGDVYTPRAAQASERALIELGIFSTASVTLADPEQADAIKDVVVEVSERRQQSLEARAGFSTADGPRVRLRYRYGNLAGTGLGFELGGDVSYQLFFAGTDESFQAFVEELSLLDRLERLVVASLALPHVPVIGRVVGARLDLSHERDNDPGFGVTRTGAALSLSARWRPYVTGQLQVGVEWSDIAPVFDQPFCDNYQPDPELPGDLPIPGVNCIAYCEQLGIAPYEDVVPDRGDNCIIRNDRSVRLSRQPEGSALFLVSRALVSVDLRDSPFNPTRGFFGSVSGEHVYSLLPVETEDERGDPIELTSHLLRFGLLANGYVPLGFLDWVLALSVRFGWIFELSRDTTTFADRFFYLGGFDGNRGWAQDAMDAEDQPGPGGQSMLLLRAELRIPLPSSFALGVFVDAGDIWRQQTMLWEQFSLRVAVGAGLRYNTPVGPIALDLGWEVPRASRLEAIDRMGEEARQAAVVDLWTPQVHFAIGLF